jgi:hypothetical protein
VSRSDLLQFAELLLQPLPQQLQTGRLAQQPKKALSSSSSWGFGRDPAAAAAMAVLYDASGIMHVSGPEQSPHRPLRSGPRGKGNNFLRQQAAALNPGEALCLVEGDWPHHCCQLSSVFQGSPYYA